MTSATDELRRLLDERGVEWRRTPHYSSESQDNETVFEGNGIEWYANDHLNGRLGLRTARYEVTPEQAIDATLGRGTCHAIEVPMGMHDDATETVCSACRVAIDELSEMNYCPNCGRAVVK